MFGVLRGAGCSMKPEEQAHWMNHICGVCLALRDRAGHAARITTNYDAALLSVLCEAQSETPTQQTTSCCPLRGSRFRAEVVAPENAGAQYAASVALTAGAVKIADHVADGETVLRHAPGVARTVARRWQAAGSRLAQTLGFDTHTLTRPAARQAHVEAATGRDFLYYAQPTEQAVAAAFAHTAVVAHRPNNALLLHEIGRLFGRIMYLLDSYQDYDEDRDRGAFNALAASYVPERIAPEARRLFREAHRPIKPLFSQLDLPRPDLARALLIRQLHRRGSRVLGIVQAACQSCGCRASVAEASGVGTDALAFSYQAKAVAEQREAQQRRQSFWDWCCCCDGCCCDCCDCGDGCCCGCDCCDC